MVKAKGGPIAADGLYGQWQSPPYPPATISPTNTITLSESERNNPFPIFPRLNCPLLPSSFPPFVSPPPFDVVQLYQGNSLELGNFEFRNVSRLLIYLSLSLFSLPVTIKSKVFDPSIRKIKKRKDTSLRGTRVLLSTAIFVVRFYRQAIVARSIARLESSGMLSK